MPKSKLQGFNPTNPPDESQLVNVNSPAWDVKSLSAGKLTSEAELRAQAKARGTLEESLVEQLIKGKLPKGGPAK